MPWLFCRDIKILTNMSSSNEPRPTAVEIVANRIRQRRTELSLTAEHVAHKSSMTVRHFQRLEGAETASPGLQPLLRIAHTLRIDSGDLLGGLTPDDTAP